MIPEIENKMEFLNMQSTEEDSCYWINLITESEVALSKDFYSKEVIGLTNSYYVMITVTVSYYYINNY